MCTCVCMCVCMHVHVWFVWMHIYCLFQCGHPADTRLLWWSARLSISEGSEGLQLGFLATRRGRVKGPSHPGDLSEHRSPGPSITGQGGSSCSAGSCPARWEVGFETRPADAEGGRTSPKPESVCTCACAHVFVNSRYLPSKGCVTWNLKVVTFSPKLHESLERTRGMSSHVPPWGWGQGSHLGRGGQTCQSGSQGAHAQDSQPPWDTSSSHGSVWAMGQSTLRLLHSLYVNLNSWSSSAAFFKIPFLHQISPVISYYPQKGVLLTVS